MFGIVLVGAIVAIPLLHHVESSPADEASATGVSLDPSYFADGACEAFSPTAGDRDITVFLDAGHGGPDPGGVGTTEDGTNVTEGALNLPTALDTMALLRADGFRVVVSRTRDSSVLRLHPADLDGDELTILGSHDDVAARDVCANLAGADLLIGLYLNAGSPGESGAVTTYDPDRRFSAASERLADLVQGDVLNSLNSHGWQIPNDGVLTDGGLGSAVAAAGSSLAAKAQDYNHILLIGPAEKGYFSTPSTMPGVVTEPLFLSDPFEASVAASSAGQHAVAAGVAQAVQQYFAHRRS